jgi:chromosome segregation ATPase
LKGSCPTCGKDYTSADNTKVVEELDCKNSELNTALDSIKNIETFINSNKSQLKEIESEIEKTSKSLYDVNFKISELNKSLSKDLSELESEKQNLIDKYELLNNKLKTEEVALDEASNLLEGYSLSIVDTGKLSQLMDEIMSYQNAVEKNQQLIKDKIQWEEAKKNQQLSLEEFTHQLNTVKIELKNNMEVKDLINNKFTNYIIVGVCSTLTNEMNKFIQAIFPNIKVVVTLLNKGIGIHYYPTDSSEKSISSKMASGFQKELISLSFRVALCKMHGMSFSFFDEIDSSSSQKNSEIVMNYLMTSSIFNQLFFITQKKTTVDYIVYNFPDVALIQAKNGKLEKLSYNND